MKPIDPKAAISPDDAAGDFLAGPARRRVRRLGGDLIVVAIAIGRCARAAETSRRALARATGGAGGLRDGQRDGHGDGHGGSQPAEGGLAVTMALLARAVTWASMLRADLREGANPAEPSRTDIPPTGSRRVETPRPPPASSPASSPASARPPRLTLRGEAPAGHDAPATIWKRFLRRLRVQQAREARGAMLRGYVGSAVPEILAQIGADLLSAAHHGDAPDPAARARETLRRLAAELGLSALPAPIAMSRSAPRPAPRSPRSRDAEPDADGLRALHEFQPLSRAEQQAKADLAAFPSLFDPSLLDDTAAE